MNEEDEEDEWTVINSQQILFTAVETNDLFTCRSLLFEHNVHIDYLGDCFMMPQNGGAVAEKMDAKIIHILWSFLVHNTILNVNHKMEGNTILMHAVRHNRPEILEFLLNVRNIDVNLHNVLCKTTLHLAAELGNAPAVKLLISKRGIKIDVNNTIGHTPWCFATALTIASFHGHSSVVDLLARVSNVNVKDGDNYTALHIASQRGYSKIVKTLLKIPSLKANLTDPEGRTALYLASKNGHTDVVRHFLISGRVNVNARNRDGWTSLIAATKNRHLEIVRLLLKVENIELKDVALKMAIRNSDAKIIELLKKRSDSCLIS